MSKIYEALRQAELDRANGVAPPADSTPARPSTSSQVLLEQPVQQIPAQQPPAVFAPIATSPAPFAIRDSAPANPAPIQVPAAVLDDIAAPPVDTPSVDLAGVRFSAWTPTLYQLPALEEKGAGVEQFRSLRSRMYEFRDLNTLKSILVSSGLPQEGKSFVAANLAISFARHRSGRVLLIDGDMRRASLHKLFGCEIGPGLTEFLAGKATIAEIMQRPITDDPEHPLPHGLATLTFIPGGHMHDKAADLSGNRRFDRLITAVAPFFDWIVVDSSPVNLVSDGVNLARAVDAALLIARGGVTKFETAQRALTELKATKILGYVLNAVADPPAAGGYYGYDAYDKETE